MEINDMIIKFIFPTFGFDEYMTFDYLKIIHECPVTQKLANFSKNDINFELPEWISPNELMEYLYLCKNGLHEYLSLKTELIKFLKISELFENYKFTRNLIKDCILENIDKYNCLIFLEISYEKLNDNGKLFNYEQIDHEWIELFYSALDILAKNITLFLNNHIDVVENIRMRNKKIIEELFVKSFFNLIINNFIFLEEKEFLTYLSNVSSNLQHSSTGIFSGNDINYLNIQDFENLINYLMKVRNMNNIYDLMINEFLTINSEENMKELESNNNTILQVAIPSDLRNYYNEFSIDIGMGKEVIFVVFYKQSDDSLNVAFKLTNKMSNNKEFDTRGFNIYTFASSITIDDINCQYNVKSAVPNNKSSYQIFKLNNLKQHLISNSKTRQSSYTNTSSNFVHRQDEIDINRSFNNLNIDSVSGNIKLHNKSKSEFFIDNKTINSYSVFFKEQPSDVSYANFSEKLFNKVNIDLKINFKICYIHTAIISFILSRFNKFYDHPNVNKLSIQIFRILIKNKFIRKDNEDQVVIALLNFLNDEINVNDDISDILEYIEWKSVSIDIFFEFIIKHYKIIETCEMSKFFMDNLLLRMENLSFSSENGNLNNRDIDKNEIFSRFAATLFSMIFNFKISNIGVSKKINYSDIILQNKKLEKINYINLQNSFDCINLRDNNLKTKISEEQLKNSIIKNNFQMEINEIKNPIKTSNNNIKLQYENIPNKNIISSSNLKMIDLNLNRNLKKNISSGNLENSKLISRKTKTSSLNQKIILTENKNLSKSTSKMYKKISHILPIEISNNPTSNKNILNKSKIHFEKKLNVNLNSNFTNKYDSLNRVKINNTSVNSKLTNK